MSIAEPRILLISSQPIPHVGGLSTHFELLRSSLERSRHLHGVVTGQDIELDFHRRVALGTIRLIAGRDVARRKTLDVALKRLSDRIHPIIRAGVPDLIHCHDPLGTVAAHIASRHVRTSIPLIQTVHGPWSREALMGGARPGGQHLSRIRDLEKRSFAAANTLIAVDQGQADILLSDFNVPVQKLRVVPNGIDVSAIACISGQPSPIVSDAPYFLVPRRLVKKNGVEVAIRAVARLQSRTELFIAGDGPLRRELKDCAAALGISHRVRLLGHLQQSVVLPLMRAALGVVIPSVPADGVVEATSLAAMEAMACGTPILVSNIGGLRDIACRANIGFTFSPGDASALSRHMRSLEVMSCDETSALRSRFLGAARTFDVDKWFSATQAAYSKTLCDVDTAQAFDSA